MYCNEELRGLYGLPGIVRVMKSRLKWTGIIVPEGETKKSYRVWVGITWDAATLKIKKGMWG